MFFFRLEEWFQDALLPNISPKSLIVMDNASYHSRRSEAMPNRELDEGKINGVAG